jgi:hypothetical protein
MEKNKGVNMLKITLSFVCTVLVLIMVGNYFKDKQRVADEYEVRDLITKSMKVTQPKISLLKQQIFTDTLVRVTQKVFTKQENRLQFVVIVGIESGLNPDIGKSKADAVGPAQVLGKYVKEFAKMCNLPEIDVAKDIYDTEINLTVGACLFKNLSDKLKNPSLAALAYNAGTHSKSMDQMLKLTTVTNQETASYVAKFS